MLDDETGVAAAHWECDAVIPAIATLRGGVDDFAQRHGMRAPARQDLAAAVSEAVAVAMGGHAGEHVVCDAATDGAWLSVRIGGGADACGAPSGLRLACAVADRVECTEAAGGQGTRVLMEFDMAGPRTTGPARHLRRSRPPMRLGAPSARR